MTTASTVSIQTLDAASIPRAMELVAAANWNQTPRDWRRLIETQPAGCFKAVLDGALVGTVTSTSYQNDLAWIGMMLVDANQRRRGIGSELMKRVIDYLLGERMATIKLDATPLGRPLYTQLGFQFEHDFQRWRRPAPEAVEDSGEPSPQLPNETPAAGSPSKFDSDHYAALDLEAFGIDRRSWLERVAGDSRVACREDGFGMLRAGRIADYLGPITARDPRCARSILDELLSGTTAAVIWDVPHGNPAAALLARELGFEPVRELTRMWLGKELRPKTPACQFALCDPATG